MSFTANKSAVDGTPQGTGLPVARGNASAPAFRPQIVRSVRMHPALAVGVGAVVLLLLVGYALTQKSVYQAVSQVYEEPAAAKLLADSGSANNFDANRYETFLGEQMQLVQRLDVLTTALTALPEATWREYGDTAQQAAETIQQQMKVVRVATSYQISISLKGSNPRRTADIVNAITSAYLDAVHKETAADSDQRGQLLAEERQRIETELQAARTEQTTLGGVIGVANLAGESGNPYDSELSGIRAQLTEARAAHDMAAAQLAALSGPGPTRNSALTAAADEVIAGDAGLSSLKANISQRKAALNGQMAGMKPENPVYRQDQDELAELDRTLDASTNDLRTKAERRLQDRLRSDLERTGDVEARLNSDLAAQIAAATSAGPKLQRATEVAADIQRLDAREAAVDDALRSLRLDANGPAQVRLSLAATAPEHPEANRRKMMLLSALPLALLCGIGAAVLARKQDQHIYIGPDIQDVLGFPPMAVLPARNDVPGRVFDEYVLRLAAGVESAYRTSGARTFLMTAVSLTTDIEPLASALTRKFEEIGVNVMAATAAEMLMRTDSASAPDGEQPGSNELLRPVEFWSEGFVAANMAKMKTEHGLVLIGSQALLNCAQTEYVARCADATILVIECGVTTRQELYSAAELLQRLNVTGVGAVLEELQLRYAQADFREAIEALDRRQSEGLGQTRERATVAPVETEKKAEPSLSAGEPIVETAAEVTEPPPLANLWQAEPQFTKTPSYHAVLDELPVEGPETAEPKWELPPIAAAAKLVEAAHHPAEAVASHRDAVGAIGPMLVGKGMSAESGDEEILDEQPLIVMANGTSHEKMTANLSARRDVPGPHGDASMSRKRSWFGRLLGRDAEPIVSIIPGADDEETAGSEEQSVSRAEARAKKDDYDVPLASRLEQISRARPVAPSGITSPNSRSSRLQIVPPEYDEPRIVNMPYAAPAMLGGFSSSPMLGLEAPEFAAAGEEIWAEARTEKPVAPVMEAIAEPASASVASAEEAPRVAAVSAPKPRRPLTFQELAKPVEAAPAGHSEPVRMPVIAEVVKEIAAPASETPATPVVEEQEVARVHAEEAHQIESEPSEAAVAEAVAPSPAPLAEEPRWFAASEQAGLAVPGDASEAEPAWGEEQDAYDLEPVYEEASRNLPTGRWDPIPPLRPSVSDWRDRRATDSGSFAIASAMPPRQRWTGTDEDSQPVAPYRWIPEPEPAPLPQPEQAPEPVLTRQWGLLSRFQQARISGSRPVAGSTGEPEKDRETVPPDSSSGHRQG